MCVCACAFLWECPLCKCQCTVENLGFSQNWSRNKFKRRALPSRVAVKPQLNPSPLRCCCKRTENGERRTANGKATAQLQQRTATPTAAAAQAAQVKPQRPTRVEVAVETKRACAAGAQRAAVVDSQSVREWESERARERAIDSGRGYKTIRHETVGQWDDGTMWDERLRAQGENEWKSNLSPGVVVFQARGKLWARPPRAELSASIHQRWLRDGSRARHRARKKERERER